ncbi:hypothetical protein [Iodidimonas sp. SYSU 1G8]|uniref:hypothetical protein n=1 Tax=Iodidimonas sp. SYSU 1G8 TaxID=3133967 RepID=UPI0031FF3801
MNTGTPPGTNADRQIAAIWIALLRSGVVTEAQMREALDTVAAADRAGDGATHTIQHLVHALRHPGDIPLDGEDQPLEQPKPL